MYITFFNNDFKPISDNSSLVIEKYSLRKRSYDLNEMSCTCEPIDLDIQPMFASVKNDKGKVLYDCLAPIITRNKDNKSKVIARDLKGLLNTEIIYDGTIVKKTIQELFISFFNTWKNFANIGFTNIDFDISAISDLSGEVYQPSEKNIFNAWSELFKPTMAVYNLHLETSIDYRTKTLIFKLVKNNELLQKVKLEDYGIVDFNKTSPSINTAIVINEQFNKVKEWRLLKDGSITDTKPAEYYPTSVKIYKSNTEAILGLAENRNQEAIQLKITEIDRLFSIDFNSSLMLYYKGKEYKTLPIGEIEYNEKNELKITVGSKPVDFIQIV